MRSAQSLGPDLWAGGVEHVHRGCGDRAQPCPVCLSGEGPLLTTTTIDASHARGTTTASPWARCIRWMARITGRCERSLLAGPPKTMRALTTRVGELTRRHVGHRLGIGPEATSWPSGRGAPIAASDAVYPSYVSANRDEDVFDEPLLFDIARESNRHLGFGLGVHFCLGAHRDRQPLRGTPTRLHSVELAGEPQFTARRWSEDSSACRSDTRRSHMKGRTALIPGSPG
jgi:hypothetical protein